MEVKGHVPFAELQRLEREEKEARRARRLRIIILAIQRYTAPAIAMSLGLSRRVCQAWVYRYNEQGLQGLEDQRGKTPRGPLTDEQQEQMQQRLEQGAMPEDGVGSLRGLDVQHILAREFHTRIELRQIGVRDEAKLLRAYPSMDTPFAVVVERFLDPVDVGAAVRSQRLGLRVRALGGPITAYLILLGVAIFTLERGYVFGPNTALPTIRDDAETVRGRC